jgi:hypothetical protein
LDADGSATDEALDAIDFGTADVGYAGTNGLGIFRTEDGGRTWHLEESPFDDVYAGDTFRGSIAAAGPEKAVASGPGAFASRQP